MAGGFSGDGSLGAGSASEDAVLEALARIDRLRARGLEPSEIAEAMRADGAPVPAGGTWSAEKVERIIGVFETVRHEDDGEGRGPGPAPAPVQPSDPPTTGDGGATAATEGPVPAAGDGRERWAVATAARWLVVSVALAGVGAGGYLAIDAIATTSPNDTQLLGDATTTSIAGSTAAVTPGEAADATIDATTPTTATPDPADTMAIRIETDQPTPSGTGADGEDLVPATATIRTDGRLYIEGAFATEAEAGAFVERASSVFGRENVVESYVVDAGAPAPQVADVSLDKPVLFESGTAVIHPDYIPFLEACAGVLELNPHIVMSVTAYTDSVGSEEFNLALSRERAQAIVDFYRDRQIGDDQLVAIGVGEADPVANNETEDGRSRNRRAMLELLNVVGEQAAGLDGG